MLEIANKKAILAIVHFQASCTVMVIHGYYVLIKTGCVCDDVHPIFAGVWNTPSGEFPLEVFAGRARQFQLLRSVVI